jgi:hypothetical protein
MKRSALKITGTTIVLLSATIGIFSVYAHNRLSGLRKTASPSEAITTSNARKIKIALLLDTSNSMDGLIEQAKSQLWTIVNELAAATADGVKPELQIALYEYGNDRLPASEGHIRQVTPLTNDLDKISQDLFTLTTNGGDEFCGYAVKTASSQLDWSADGKDLQVIFIAGNEPFTQGNVHYREACLAAKNKNIVVNTIFCGNYQEGILSNWKDGADITGGSYMSIEQNNKTVFIPSPYDDQINQLNIQLNQTYIEYGREGKVKKEMQQRQDKNAEVYGKENSVNRAVSKTSHVYKNKSWDMVDASDDKEFDASKIKPEELPDNMKTMTAEEKKQYIESKKAEREKIKSEIGELSKQREAYISKQKQNQGDAKTLDKSMMNSIRKQAEQKNFMF